MATRRKSQKTPMSQDHKDALAKGRDQGRAVRAYLEALEQHKPKRGRKRTAESVSRQLQQVEEQLATADPLERVHLLQQRITLKAELASKGALIDLVALVEGFLA